MIAFLSGTVQAKTEHACILNCQGVGYLIHMPQDLHMQVREGKKMDVFIYTIVREQEISLYGFSTLAERSFFELLISVSGIGPKSALEFLSIPMETMKDAIVTGDTVFISKVKGVGKKTAERVVVELKNKLGSIEHMESIVVSEDEDQMNASQDVLLALEGLGYERMFIVKKLKNAPQFNSTEEAVMWFLQNAN